MLCADGWRVNIGVPRRQCALIALALYAAFEVFLPSGVCLARGFDVGSVGLYHFQTCKRLEGLAGIAVDSCADSGTFCGTYGAICVIKFDNCATYVRQRLTEEGRKEEVRVAGMDAADLKSHAFHDADAMLEGENYAFLGGT